MTWLKATPVFKHGLGDAHWLEVYHPSLLDEVKEEFRMTEGDPEGFREPLWELHDAPPIDVLRQKIAEAYARQTSAMHTVSRYTQLLWKVEDNE